MNYKKTTILLINFLLLTGMHLYCQSIDKELEKTMIKVRKNQFREGTMPFNDYIKNEPGLLIRKSVPYTNDSSEGVRLYAYELIHQAGRKSNDSAIRQMAVRTLVSACKDNESGNVSRVSMYLHQYNREDFSEVVKDSISTLIKHGSYHRDNILLLAGYLDLKNSIPDIQSVIANPQYTNNIKWAAHLALSRMGDSLETDYCIRIVQTNTMNDNVARVLLPGLIYTHQKDAYCYLVTMLNSDDKNCTLSNTEEKINIECGYKVLKLIAPEIEDFPLNNLDFIDIEITEENLNKLATARAWFKEKGDSYVIKDESF